MMKTKEAIAKRILHYIDLSWDVQNINNLPSLVHLMIEAVSHELSLIDNRLEELDMSIADKLVKHLLPPGFNYERPSHSVLKVSTTVPMYQIDKHVEFSFKELPERLKHRFQSKIVFTPATTATVHDIEITHLFCDQTLWSVEKERKIMAHSKKRAKYNTIWIGLTTLSQFDTLNNLVFYLDFPHLKDHHLYYEIMSQLKWSIDGEILKSAVGFPIAKHTDVSIIESEVLAYYKDHYQTILSPIEFKNIPKRKLPYDLIDIFGEEESSSLPPLYWISVEFPANFEQEDLKKISIAFNAIPVINRRYNTCSIKDVEFGNVISLPSQEKQNFLEIESISDNTGKTYKREDQLHEKCSYMLETVRQTNVDDPRIIDYLERLADIVQEERSSFPAIDNEKIIHVLNVLSSIQDKDTGRVLQNRLRDLSNSALLSLCPGEEANLITTNYWTTHSELLNEFIQKSGLTANSVPILNKSDAYFLTPLSGGRSFGDSNSLKQISNFYLSSKGRILTKYNILSFCKLELGRYIEKVDVVHKAIISHKLKEGIIIVMEIQITPKTQSTAYFKQKGVLKDFLIRLRRISPANFNYRVVVKEKEISEALRIKNKIIMNKFEITSEDSTVNYK
ncbi:type VI secretion system baseplate subunit TssF [Bacteroides sp. 224]|uniref:type VI secretion system baseplate subunit TssF n=1 Tax=Bacteroides sp. 224 TaxID=2302936 RepID=UPI0013D7AE86|nr:type VI secretion system baseplate subunit TssF [Bacteroides sp. 224]NDV65221.1 hypothetical protein [Bacteroides sp. 224]